MGTARKPHEEEWFVDARQRICIVQDSRDIVVFDTSTANAGDVQLAAAAPEMARLLLSLEGGDVCMLECQPPAREHPDQPAEHHPACRWLRVMRMAGVRP